MELEGWQDYDFLPEAYQSIKRSDLSAFELGFTPAQRVQFSFVLEAVEQFIQEPERNQIFIGGVGSHCSVLAAYIARQLEPVPNIFITLRQLVDILIDSEAGNIDRAREVFFNIPVLIIDDFSSTYSQIDEGKAQALYEIVHHRFDNGLPIVLASDVEFDQMWAIHPPLLDCLGQDADFYVFDYQQIQIRRPAMRSFSSVQPSVPSQTRRCPWLGMRNGAETDHVFPMPDHCCRRTVIPQLITLAYQAGSCLSADHQECPVFRTPDGQSLEELPGDILRKERPPAYYPPAVRIHPVILLTVVGIVLALVVGGLMVFSEMSQPTPPVSTSRAAATLVPAVIPSSTVSPAATSVTAAAAPTMTATLAPVTEISLAQDARLRLRPEVSAPGLRFVSAGTSLRVLGRDIDGDWLRAESADGLAGWVQVIFVAEDINVLALPIYGESTATPEGTPTSEFVYASEVPPTLTPTLGIPSTFTIFMQSVNISACEYPDVSFNYTFRLTGIKISISRPEGGTTLTGSYNPDTGVFRVSTTHDFGLEDMSGAIKRVGDRLEVSGEHQLSYFDDSCTVLWALSGQTLIVDDR